MAKERNRKTKFLLILQREDQGPWLGDGCLEWGCSLVSSGAKD